jgi:hypothetical protein
VKPAVYLCRIRSTHDLSGEYYPCSRDIPKDYLRKKQGNT